MEAVPVRPCGSTGMDVLEVCRITDGHVRSLIVEGGLIEPLFDQY